MPRLLTLCAGGSRIDAPPTLLNTAQLAPLAAPPDPTGAGSSAAHQVILLRDGGPRTAATHPAAAPASDCHAGVFGVQCSMLLLLMVVPLRLLCNSRPVLGLRPPNSPARAPACKASALGLSAAATAVARSLVEPLLTSRPGSGAAPPREPHVVVLGVLQGSLQEDGCCVAAVGVRQVSLLAAAAAGLASTAAGCGNTLLEACACCCCCCSSSCCCGAALWWWLGEQMAALMAANLQNRATGQRHAKQPELVSNYAAHSIQQDVQGTAASSASQSTKACTPVQPLECF